MVTVSNRFLIASDRSRSELDPYTDWARWIARTQNPFASMNAVFYIGMRYDDNTNPDRNPGADANDNANRDTNEAEVPNPAEDR